MGDSQDSQPAAPDQQRTVRIEWRGRDIALAPPAALWPLDDAALYQALFGDEAAGLASALLRRDMRARVLRARPLDGAWLKVVLLQMGWDVAVAFDERPALPWPLRVTLTPRPYQEDALTAWRAEGCRGVVVLPTGSGKTLVGALAIAEVELATLVVVPTIDLLRQWQRALAEALGRAPEDIGVYGGGTHDAQAITIITYESAALHPELLRRFGLLIFDECHHLPAQTYRQIAEGAYTPQRLGLSATPERADDEHLALERLIGPEVYRRAPAELAAARYLASYDEQRLTVALSPEDAARYDEARAAYSGYLRQRHIIITSPADFQRKILWASARDPEARAAMLAWREARSLAMNAPAKFALLEELFARHAGERVLVFSEYNTLVDEVSRRFAIPQITHKTRGRGAAADTGALP